MTDSTMQLPELPSTRPYFLRSLYEWCTDNGYTPYIAVYVDEHVHVPQEFVRDHQIVLNISFKATSHLQIGNDWIEFTARFSGKARKIRVPVNNVLAIYSSENGHGMAFSPEKPGGVGGVLHETHETLRPSGQPNPVETTTSAHSFSPRVYSNDSLHVASPPADKSENAKDKKGTHLKIIK